MLWRELAAGLSKAGYHELQIAHAAGGASIPSGSQAALDDSTGTRNEKNTLTQTLNRITQKSHHMASFSVGLFKACHGLVTIVDIY